MTQLPQPKPIRDVTQPLMEGRSLDRDAHILAFIDEMREPLERPFRTLRSRTLETTGMHHNFWGDAEWARRVNEANEQHRAKLRLGDVAEGVKALAVQASMKANGVPIDKNSAEAFQQAEALVDNEKVS